MATSDQALHKSSNDDAETVVKAATQGKSGRLVLNRPKALNSLNREMVGIVRDRLNDWLDDASVNQVVISSGHPKAFCAGGDVRSVREDIIGGTPQHGEDFFIDEYAMNAEIAQFAAKKPYIAIIDGIAMGGGLGISMHGSHRVVTERASAAMPEMAIGFIPDVGITHFAQRVATADGKPSVAVARFAGLTGYRLTAADMLWSGWATHLVPSVSLKDFENAIDENGIEEALSDYAMDPRSDAGRELVGESTLAQWRPCIEACFGFDTWLEIERALDERGAGGLGCTREQISEFNSLLRSASAASLVAATELYTANAKVGVDLKQSLDNEMKVGKLMRGHRNFVEGVRAVLVDKDRNARFDPQRADSVDPEQYRAVLS